MNTTVAVLQHEPMENAGYLEQLWKEEGIDYRILRLYQEPEIPVWPGTHLLIMGGSMSVHDEREYPFLREEKQWIRKYIRENRPILGICLGAQLIADAMGARVFAFRREMGWTRILCHRHTLPFPSSFTAFQLHGDTFEIPPGGRLLCTGDRVPHQAFSIGSATGLQFHPEVTHPLIEDWIQDRTEEEKGRIRYDTHRHLPSSMHRCRQISRWFLAQGGGNG